MNLDSSTPTDFAINLAASLAYDLMQRGASVLRDAVWGDAETRALRAAWEQAFAHLLATLKINEIERELAEHTADILRDFIGDPHVAQQLIGLALLGETPSLPELAQAFARQRFAATTLPLDFETLLTVLSEGLTHALQTEATQPTSPPTTASIWCGWWPCTPSCASRTRAWPS